jgi:small-conductance mechanosensitive channel
MSFLDTMVFGNSLERWMIALAVATAIVIALRLFERVVIRRLHALAGRTKTDWDDLLAHTLSQTKLLVLGVLAVFAAAHILTLPVRTRSFIDTATVLALLIQGGIWAAAAVAATLDRYRKRQLAEADRGEATAVGALAFVARLAVWAIVVLLGLDNLGIDVTALVAGLGIGGVAIALAVQNVLGDLFASLSILLDKPFVVGDFLIVGDLMGSVEHVGIKSTRVRSLSGEQLIFSNADLLGSRIRNYGRMYQRRVVQKLGVTYQTPRSKLERIPTIIREAVEAQEKTRFDRSHFAEYGDFSINFETVYYVLDPAYNLYMDIQQAINLKLHERFEAEGIEFAYPTQTLFLEKTAG